MKVQFLLCLAVLTACTTSTKSNQSNSSVTSIQANKGEDLFNKQCTQCHSAGEDRRIGPGLKNINDRLPQPAEAYFLNYVRNNEKVFQ